MDKKKAGKTRRISFQKIKVCGSVCAPERYIQVPSSPDSTKKLFLPADGQTTPSPVGPALARRLR